MQLEPARRGARERLRVPDREEADPRDVGAAPQPLPAPDRHDAAEVLHLVARHVDLLALIALDDVLARVRVREHDVDRGRRDAEHEHDVAVRQPPAGDERDAQPVGAVLHLSQPRRRGGHPARRAQARAAPARWSRAGAGRRRRPPGRGGCGRSSARRCSARRRGATRPGRGIRRRGGPPAGAAAAAPPPAPATTTAVDGTGPATRLIGPSGRPSSPTARGREACRCTGSCPALA